MKIKIHTKILIGILIAAVLLVGTVIAHENFTETKQLIDSGISCNKLTTEQLEEIGDYYMEQMHPGEVHEQMHNMMGGEESETIKLMHINMAKMMYCNNGEGMNNMMNMMSGGMMNGMMGSGGMMAGEMMGNNYQTSQNYNLYQSNFFIFQIFFYIILILAIVVLILVIILLIKKTSATTP